ncbi:hypothetical protein SLS56_010796 [Neofusicoccum ribis]|uniref:Fungal calcium binding protein domain-containing protein n=1 Tax=Neofusicoccum ribis TaxID=45134 RepID=A0ABR3SDI4_9PEZI
MHFTGLVTAALATAAVAAPSNAIVQRQAETTPNVTPAQLVFAAQADDCSILSCAAVIASAGCIAAGIATAEVPAVLGCVAGGASQSLEDFLNSNGLCTS